MNRQDAIKSLLRAGKQQDVKDTIDKWVSKAHDAYAETRKSAAWTDEYKRWMMAVDYTQISRGLSAELERMAAGVIRTDRDDAERVFGTRGLAGDAASLLISRRDASDRVASASTSGELREILARATRSGDEVLARAVAERAMALQDAPTLHQFLEDRPALDSAVERLWRAEQAAENSIQFTMQLFALKPSELQGSSAGAIEHLAENEPQVAKSGW